MPSSRTACFLPLFLILAVVLPAAARAADQPQWGEANTRNMVSAETGLPDAFDPVAGKNVKWIAQLGSDSYATPVVAGGRVFIGTNNEVPRDPAHKGDRGILLCLNEKDGSLVWQLVVPKFGKDPYTDWPRVGICSSPTVEGDRVYLVTNRNEVLCLDIHGLANGNDGPFKDEARQLTPQDAEAPESLTRTDADILWIFDLAHDPAVRIIPHDNPHSSILIHGGQLYVNTSSGVGSAHKGLRNVDGPSLVVIDKETGKLLAADAEGIGPHIFHCNWSSPSLGESGGKTLLFYGGSDGIIHAMEPYGGGSKLKGVWTFDCDPDAPKGAVKYWGNRAEGPSSIQGMSVVYQNRLYVACGGDIWWGKKQSWLKCIDVAGAKPALRWSCPLSMFSVCTPAVGGGLVYATDCGRNITCIDIETGQPVWTHDAEADQIWGSVLLADGKVYVGARNGTALVLAAGREKKVLCQVKLEGRISGSPVAANGAVYISTAKKLYAFQESR